MWVEQPTGDPVGRGEGWGINFPIERRGADRYGSHGRTTRARNRKRRKSNGAENMAKTTKRPGKRKRGRPTRAAASKKALKGVDLSGVDPEQILREIAADSSAPAAARLAAVRELRKPGSTNRQTSEPPTAELDAVTRRALKIINGGRA